MRKIVSDEFRQALPSLIQTAKASWDNTKEFEVLTGITATCHVVHLGEKLLEALNELDKVNQNDQNPN